MFRNVQPRRNNLILNSHHGLDKTVNNIFFLLQQRARVPMIFLRRRLKINKISYTVELFPTGYFDIKIVQLFRKLINRRKIH